MPLFRAYICSYPRAAWKKRQKSESVGLGPRFPSYLFSSSLPGDKKWLLALHTAGNGLDQAC